MKINKPLSVAFFLPSLEPGGAERNVVNIVNNVNRGEYEISLVLGEKKGEFINKINKNIPIVSLNAPGSFKLFLKLANYFKKEKPDIFVSSFTRINIICIAAKIFSRTDTRIIATEHAVFSFLPTIAKTASRRFFAYFFLPSIAKVAYRWADAIICVSQGMAADFAKIVGYKEKIRVIYNPVTNDEIKKLAEESLSETGFARLKTPLIVAVGRLVKCKNYPGLFRAFRQVLEKHPAHLVILGNGPEEDSLKKLARELSLSSHITFLGFQSNPYKYMKRASVFALSSVQEGFGNVLIEAMVSGCPVVPTDCPTGPGEIIENMKSGILVPVDDEKVMAEAILEILNNPGLAEEISTNGKIRAEFFSVKKSVEEYEKVFETLAI